MGQKIPFLYKLAGFFVEAISNIQLVLVPFAAGAIAGAFIYFPHKGVTRLILAIICALAGLTLGILWARSVRKTQTATEYIARNTATPDIYVEDEAVPLPPQEESREEKI